MEYLTVQETAEKWGLSPRTVQQLCSQGEKPALARAAVRQEALECVAKRL